jgi:ketosteroid isomerase-like protein
MSRIAAGPTPREFLRDYDAALRARDLEALDGLIAEDAIFFFSNETSHVGKEAVLTAMHANFDAIANESYAMTNVVWLETSDRSALCVYDFEWTGEIGGASASGRGRGTTALRREGEKWRIVHEHLSQGRLLAR